MSIPLFLGLLSTTLGSPDGPPHAENAVFRAVVDEGLAVGDRAVRLPAPTFPDGQAADDRRSALRELAGSDRAVEDFLRDSVTAPFLLSLDDRKAEGAIVRTGHLYFSLRVDLDEIDPADLFTNADPDAGPVEAGNMRFEARVLGPEEAPDADDAPPGARLVHSTGRLLDRIAVESTSVVLGSRSAESMVVASMTDRRLDGDDRRPNRWATIEGRGDDEKTGPPHPYAGGIGYAKLTRLEDRPGTVLVELHFAFAEPTEWFDGAPILRSKFSLIAQDQIRRLRRELQSARPSSED
ncbi:hypothetical protein [Tautonia plasticadhaerens]|uniref:Uncharacterized protein n=1 Tax=Tautonia plasticadhaerens TaxID=2527974 RepID=A0A518H0V3_9BACT|nr:hypothetical protein [Tautonia plasticadhaerens]QDV34453.1 hypothetical protein ElP_23420 [Tautonia plasticadhaerens]